MEAMHGGLAGHETAAARVTSKVKLAEEAFSMTNFAEEDRADWHSADHGDAN